MRKVILPFARRSNFDRAKAQLSQAHIAKRVCRVQSRSTPRQNPLALTGQIHLAFADDICNIQVRLTGLLDSPLSAQVFLALRAVSPQLRKVQLQTIGHIIPRYFW